MAKNVNIKCLGNNVPYTVNAGSLNVSDFFLNGNDLCQVVKNQNGSRDYIILPTGCSLALTGLSQVVPVYSAEIRFDVRTTAEQA